jgi:pyruvate/2-oxoglutarate/acetoin dehydrogenase E1 component/TPP-dependent pyruvate/acetoin dehydrogenase alpha subunit
MFARGLCTVEQYFAQLYADTENDPFSGGRQMNCHFATPMVDDQGIWANQTTQYNVSSDISCTGGQMARALGIAMASRKYRRLDIPGGEQFSNDGNEVSFVTIGDASTSEGVFWETVNAAAVMKLPLLVAVWDDGYGISVPVEYQTAKGSISKALEGFLPDESGVGLRIYTVKGWDYAQLCATFEKVTEMVRDQHTPALIHVQELTQPQGHSTSGSHERYKSKDRLEWEKDNDCIKRMAEWIIDNNIAREDEIQSLQEKAISFVKEEKDRAWKKYNEGIKPHKAALVAIFDSISADQKTEHIKHLESDLRNGINLVFSEVVSIARKLQIQWLRFGQGKHEVLQAFIDRVMDLGVQRYDSHLYSESPRAAINVPYIRAKYSLEPQQLNGYQILNHYFDQLLENNPSVIAFGEDVGQIGDVNQGFAGLQQKYGVDRVFDTGIREWTILGQAMGSSMRGLRPIAEIQYLDYMAYAFSLLTDDLATLRYRSNGIQCAPAIIRSRGHRLEGIWHAGSPMGMILTSMPGIYLCVPRNMVQAIGFYNTMLRSDDPAIIVECLNGYRLKEKMPDNLLDYTCPLGMPEILTEGNDLTVVSYGSCLREAAKGAELAAIHGISAEVIDAQTLMPFDLDGIIAHSLKKTNRILFVDEDVPGGATAFMMREVLEKWNGYQYLDAKPVCLSAKAHRTPFGSDGDYFTKPSADDVYDAIMKIME